MYKTISRKRWFRKERLEKNKKIKRKKLENMSNAGASGGR
jgi:hypothetical protein